MKVSLVRPGKMFEIVLNEASKRKSESVVAINDGERSYGTTAYGMYSRKPSAAFLRLRDLLGRHADHPGLVHLREHGYDYDVVADEDGSGFRVNFGEGTEDEYLYRAEEVMAMLLQYAKKIAEEHAQEGTKIHDCVITIPAFFTHFERRAMLESAEIAGLNVLTLVEENTAAALQHGVWKEFPNETSNILIYNMGAASTQVEILRFWGKPVKNSKNLTQMQVLSKAWDVTLGGDEFDKLLTDYIAEQYDKQFSKGGSSTSIRDVPRAMARIRKQARKTKEVLSANEEIPVTLESLHNDNDLRVKVSRAWLEEAGKHLFARLTKPIDRALADAGLEVTQLDGIELIGGSVRIPKVKQVLKGYFGDLELGNHLNGDEAMALGAVFMGANLSKAFRVRNVGLSDIASTPIGVDLEDISPSEPEWKKHALLFPKFSTLSSRKVVTFHHDKDISCTLNDETDPDNFVPFAQFDLSGVDEANALYGHLGKPKLSLSFFLSLNGTADLVKAEATFVEIIPVVEDTPSKNDSETEENSETEASAEGATEDKADEANGEEGSGENGEDKADKEKSKEKEETEEAASEAKNTDDAANASEAAAKKPKKPTKKVHRYPLKVSRTNKNVLNKPMPEERKQEARDLIAKFEKLEQERKQHEQEKNELESFVFSCRDRLRSQDEDVAKVTFADDVEKLFEDLETTEDWLYEDGENAPVEEYRERKKALSKRVNAIFSRVQEMVQRPLVITAARELIESVAEQRKNWTTERPWVTEDELKAVDKMCDDFSSWLDTEEAKQKELESNQEPVLTSSAIVQRLEPIQTMVEQVLKRRKPLPPKPKKKKKVEKSEDADTGSDKAGDEETKEGDASEGEPTESPTDSADSSEAERDEL